jgi:hypothetical protein
MLRLAIDAASDGVRQCPLERAAHRLELRSFDRAICLSVGDGVGSISRLDKMTDAIAGKQ